MDFRERLQQGQIVVLDGATASELQRRGLRIDAPLWTSEPLMSEDGLATLRRVHRDYVEAGAEVLTANTFRTNLRALGRAGIVGTEARGLVQRAVEQARLASRDAGRPGVFIAGSVAPVEDCYHPELTPADAELWEEHRWMARSLADAGVDLLLLETMCTVREAAIALACAREVGLPACLSFVCRQGGVVLDGEPLDRALQAVEPLQPAALMVNCTEMSVVPVALQALRGQARIPLGVYPNIEDRSHLPEWTHVDAYVPAACAEREFAETLLGWVDEFRLTLVGGCCGSTPAHIQSLRQAIQQAQEHPGPRTKQGGSDNAA